MISLVAYDLHISKQKVLLWYQQVVFQRKMDKHIYSMRYFARVAFFVNFNTFENRSVDLSRR